MTGEIEKALSILFPAGGVVELRALADYNTHSGYFDDYTVLAEKADQINRLSDVHGVYVTLNEVNPALLSRRANRVKMKLGRKDATTADADIIRRRWLPVDLDPVRPSGVSSTDEEHEAAISKAEKIAGFLETIGFPRPVLADSGNGAHLLYSIDLPNDDDATALVKDCLTTLDALFSDDSVMVDAANYNAARIWKLYGTISCKGDDTPDRPHRMAKILDAPEEMITTEADTLRRLATLLPKDEPKPPAKNGEKAIDLSRWLSEHGIAVASERPWQGGTLFVLEDCPFSSAHKDGAFAIQFDNGAIYAGCHHNSCGGGKQRWAELRAMFEIRKSKKERAKKRSEPPASSSPENEESPERTKALEILRTGDPIAFMLDTFNIEHVGDRIVAECLIMSVVSQSVLNTKGLHVSISGNSGKGKTHACSTMLNLIPPAYRLKGTVSNKALFYHENLRPGTVLLFDDVTMSEDIQELLKSATANFREQIEHRTLTTDRQLRVCKIPERCVWWLVKVENIGDDQVMNRMLTVWIDDSADQDRAVLEHMKKVEAGEIKPDESAAEICRAMWDILKEDCLNVAIPFATRIQFLASSNRRNPAMLFDLIKCHARLNFCQRKRDEEGSIIAQREDFDSGKNLYTRINGDTGGQETKLTRNEAAALSTVAKTGMTSFNIRNIQELTGLSYYQTYRMFHGYNSRGTSYAGLLEKCPALTCIDTTVTLDEDGYCVRRRENHYSFDFEMYKIWIGGGDIWLDDPPEDGDNDGDDGGDDSPDSPENLCSFTEDLQQVRKGCCKDQNSENVSGSLKEDNNIGTSTCTDSILRTSTGTQKEGGVSPSYCDSCCESGDAANKINRDNNYNAFTKLPKDIPSLGLQDCCKPLHSGKSAAKVRPLPGVPEQRDFTRTEKELGKCDLCGKGRAFFFLRRS
ncbi:conserved hypothetical protein [Methanolacinia petrolearia DSM 11571]|uniref:Uncharacterized protein n=1 Tax=Methanolacinia petrolearia (strain DSM 11571 / OCM 486 / SEBR 4847) TaxID=679926 RepID=E1RCY7_METP4|nr:hypothetical protein [Methanolacinia petrolearia]ADN35887.1 conserved hypothetical protein [Methanolacinia petrolearia DSM 11571]